MSLDLGSRTTRLRTSGRDADPIPGKSIPADRGRAVGERLLRTARPGPVAAAFAFLLLFGTTLLGLAGDWVHVPDYRHGLLLAPVALYLAWQRRVDPEDRLPARRAGLLVLAAAVLLFCVGRVMAEYFTMRGSMLLAVAGLTLFYAGVAQLRRWWLPFALLAFTIPLPEVVLNSLTLPLQLLASKVAVGLLSFRHVPVRLAGNIIRLPGHELFVAEACSGLRSLSALLGTTLLLAGTFLRRTPTRIVLMLIAIPAALVANVLRVFVTGFLVYFYGAGAGKGAFHEGVGILVFLLALAGVGLVAFGLRWWERRQARAVLR